MMIFVWELVFLDQEDNVLFIGMCVVLCGGIEGEWVLIKYYYYFQVFFIDIWFVDDIDIIVDKL